MSSLVSYLGEEFLAVASAYTETDNHGMAVYICGVRPQSDTQLTVKLPSGHRFEVGQLVTLHLDNRTGVSEYDADLKVYRASFKGRVTAISTYEVLVSAVEYQLFYGLSVMKEYREPGYEFPQDIRPPQAIAETPLTYVPAVDMEEQDNKVGVLFTYAAGQPHSTVLAFLSSEEDDIFFITFRGTFKEQVLSKDSRCYFAIDGRASFTFEHAIEWNYSIIQGRVFEVPKDSDLFIDIRERFIMKNPWEMGFFSHPDVVMFHIQPEHVVCPSHG